MSDELNETLIERLRFFSLKPNEHIDVIRSAAARLHSRAVSQDKGVRERTLERLWRKNDSIIPLLLSLLENVRDNLSCCSVAGILHECVAPRAVKHRSPALGQLLALNATQLIVRLLGQFHSKESPVVDMLLYELIWIVAQLSQKDPKFSVKTRLSGSVRTFHKLLKVHYSNPRLLYPLLILMKSLTRNVNTCTQLVKDGMVPTMERVLVVTGYSPTPKLKLSLNILHSLSRSRLCCVRMARDDFLPVLLRIFERWERYNGKMRLRILTNTITTLKHLSNTKVGRKAIRNCQGVNLLYKFCGLCPNDRLYDSLLPRVATIINVCQDKKVLPVDSPGNPAHFPLPVMKTESSDGSDITGSGSFVRNQSSRETTPFTEDGSITGSMDDDDDDEDDENEIDDDDDNEDSLSKKQDDCDKSAYVPAAPIQRDIEDLKQYNMFFREMTDSDHGDCSERSNQRCTARAKSFQEIACHSLSGDDARFGSDEIQTVFFPCYCREPKELNVDTHKATMSENSFWFTEVEKRVNNYLHTVTSHSGILTSDIQSKQSSIDLCRNEGMKNRATSEPMVAGLPENSMNNVHLTSLHSVPKHASHQYAYSVIASKVNSVYPLVKVAYPDMLGGDGSGNLEPLNVKDRKICRQKLLASVERSVHPNLTMERVVYDLDALIQSSRNGKHKPEDRHLYNLDERRVGTKDPTKYHLLFESRFESGNLRKVIQIAPHEYDLMLMPDVNSSRHHQWFYFEVSNMDADLAYTFNITNCEKQNSQFNYGMKPILYSVQEAMLGRPGWVRSGTDICYYRNNYKNPNSRSHTWYLTTSFSIVFPHPADVCYIAYHFPYPYSQLMTQIWRWALNVDPSFIYFRADSLCHSLNKNETPLLTITSPDRSSNRIKDREVVFLTARVHPGESNASWVMHGSIQYLLGSSPAAIMVRNKFIFKIVPMLNMEGVINGCHRCGLSNEDLNRRWSKPNQHLHPVIYHSKGLIEFCSRVLRRTPFMFCDFHGHSRRKNVFLYGCCNAGSWNPDDRVLPDDPVDYLMLPHLMQHFSRAFNLSACSFRVERVREATARVTVWREFGVRRSYTMESSFCGCDQGYYQGNHLDTCHLKEVGANFCEALACLKDEAHWKSELQLSPQEAARLAGLTKKERSVSPPVLSEGSDNSDSCDEEEFH